MKVEQSFYEGEVREGFYIEPKMKRAWAAQIEVLEEIRRVCKKLGLIFYADWGTLLGAVRHKGFIPWDDDLDVGMLRDDYKKFLELAPQELSPEFELKSLYNDPTHDIVKARIITGRKMNFEPSYLKRFHNCPYVVGIDIFPIDYIPRDEEIWMQQKKMIELAMGAAASIPAEPPYDDRVWNLAAKLEQMTGIHIDRELPLVHELKKMVDILSAMYGPKESDEVCSMIDYALGWESYHLDKECYGKAIEMPFEYTTIPVPVGYDAILTCKYSAEYMTPVQGGGSHDYPFYRKQEQGLSEVIEREYGINVSQEELDALMQAKIEEARK